MSVAAFRTSGGRAGWKVAIHGERPLATPAVVNGRVFLGGGFGSHSFYCFDARNGTRLWHYRTKDDGPTAAIVSEGMVAFNTESCELEVLRVDGTPVWKKWLGDPLMSMPAAAGGRLFLSYPNSRGDRRHYLGCFDLFTGQQYWARPIRGDIITAPVLAGKLGYFATLDGMLYCFEQANGDLVWSELKGATSSPVVVGGQCYFSRRREQHRQARSRQTRENRRENRQAEETMSSCGNTMSGAYDFESTVTGASWLDHEKRAAESTMEKTNRSLDSSVGFAHSKGDAKMEQAQSNLGQGTVAGIWAYQGSKPFCCGSRIYSSMGDTVLCLDLQTEKVLWKRNLNPHATAGAGSAVDSMLTPPALVNGKVFLGTILGAVVCLRQDSGQLLWHVNLGEPISFPLAVARGAVYAATQKGSLYCLDTGDPSDDGWLMWGGDAAHNGLLEEHGSPGREETSRQAPVLATVGN